jgi:hypothetical protein
VELAEFAADAVSVVEVEEPDDAGLVCDPKPKSPKIVATSARTFCRSVPKLEPELAFPEPAVGGGPVGGTGGGPPWLPSPPSAICCWKSL